MSSYWKGYRVVDPVDMDRFYSQDLTLGNMWITTTEELSKESEAQLDVIKVALSKLPPREADFVELYFFKKIRQTVIAKMFNVSQPTICYRLNRAVLRIKYLLQLPELEEGELENAMRQVLSDPIDIQIMVGMVETTCQSEVARNLSVSQGLVRHRFFRNINRLSNVNGMEKYLKVFDLVVKNLNVMRDVYRAEWNEPVIHLVA
jgi:DNA-directed RNA polymerase specialized sigma24 family protein